MRAKAPIDCVDRTHRMVSPVRLEQKAPQPYDFGRRSSVFSESQTFCQIVVDIRVPVGMVDRVVIFVPGSGSKIFAGL